MLSKFFGSSTFLTNYNVTTSTTDIYFFSSITLATIIIINTSQQGHLKHKTKLNFRKRNKNVNTTKDKKQESWTRNAKSSQSLCGTHDRQYKQENKKNYVCTKYNTITYMLHQSTITPVVNSQYNIISLLNSLKTYKHENEAPLLTTNRVTIYF